MCGKVKQNLDPPTKEARTNTHCLGGTRFARPHVPRTRELVGTFEPLAGYDEAGDASDDHPDRNGRALYLCPPQREDERDRGDNDQRFAAALEARPECDATGRNNNEPDRQHAHFENLCYRCSRTCCRIDASGGYSGSDVAQRPGRSGVVFRGLR